MPAEPEEADEYRAAQDYQADQRARYTQVLHPYKETYKERRVTADGNRGRNIADGLFRGLLKSIYTHGSARRRASPRAPRLALGS